MRARGSAVLLLVLAAVACRDKPAPGAADPANPSGPAAAVTATPAPFKSGYLRGPSKDRVIVFVNGVFGDSKSTWTNGETGAYWPQLLADDPEYADADIYVHSFESPKLSQAQEIGELGARLKNYLDAQNVIASHGKVIFVSHSMGGLIVRSYLLKSRVPHEKLGFLVFLGTPTNGANVARFASAILPSPQLANMTPLADNTYVKNLRDEWLNSSNDRRLDYPRQVSSFCAYEKLDTWGIKIVEEPSAVTLCNRGPTAILADHLDMVKPAGRDGEAYVALLSAYKDAFSPVAMQIRSALDSTGPELRTATRNFRVAELATARIALRQEKATERPVTVACGETSEGELSVAANLADGERVSEVHPEIVNGTNVASSSAAVVRFDGKTAVVRYRIEGACPGEGRADVAVNFVTSSKQRFPPGVLEYVRPTLLTTRPAGMVDVPGAAFHVLPTPTRRIVGPAVRGGGAVLIRTPSP